MTRMRSHAAGIALAGLIFSAVAYGQTGAISGKVIGEDGQGLKDALILIERKDIKGNYKVKSNKKGEYFHAGLPLGVYKVSCEVGGKVVDMMDGVRTTLGDPVEVNFDLQKMKARQQAMAKAAEAGTLTQEQSREMSPEQRAAFEKQMKERHAAMAKNKALNDAFNEGMTGLQAKQWDAAIAGFTKAAEMDPKQHVVWANMAEAYVGLAKTKTGAERDQALAKAGESYTKALEIKPDDPGMHNNYALALANAKKIPEAEAELKKAAELDPAGAGKYYYNLGAVLVNTGQTDAALEAFKKATELQPDYAPAQFQYATALSGKMQTTPDGKVIPPPGMKEALEKYLALDPNGQFAEGAKGLLMAITGSVQTSYTNPDAPKSKSKKK
ncbi:MAG: tetratricopeptide repeat protein [Bryobacterales bacterium]|nr:tetratricopeptide repeat protein [Bryobacterales bacterium]